MPFLTLALDSAGPVVGAALLVDNLVEGTWSRRIARGAERLIVPAIHDLLGERRPDIIGLAVGPGAFTGVRVGVSTALGLATAWSCPVAPVSSLAARAALRPGRPRVLSLLDARKGRLYTAVFDTRPEIPLLIDDESDTPVEELLARVGEKTWDAAVGEGVRLVAPALIASGVDVQGGYDQVPVVQLAFLARAALLEGRAQGPEAVSIRYIRPPDAVPPDLTPRLRPAAPPHEPPPQKPGNIHGRN